MTKLPKFETWLYNNVFNNEKISFRHALCSSYWRFKRRVKIIKSWSIFFKFWKIPTYIDNFNDAVNFAKCEIKDLRKVIERKEDQVEYLIETLARVPADKKFPSGQMKYLLKKNFSEFIPEEIINRKDKMGFPVPLQHWFKNDLRDFIGDTFSDISNKNRKIFQKDTFKKMNYNEGSFSRKTWALLSLELWHQNFHDKSAYYKSLVK